MHGWLELQCGEAVELAPELFVLPLLRPQVDVVNPTQESAMSRFGIREQCFTIGFAYRDRGAFFRIKSKYPEEIPLISWHIV